MDGHRLRGRSPPPHDVTTLPARPASPRTTHVSAKETPSCTFGQQHISAWPSWPWLGCPRSSTWARAPSEASSHREAPLISQDPVADATDLYAFVSPDAPDTVTLIANYYPMQDPAGFPNFYRFGDDVTYRINIDNNGDAVEDIFYQWDFDTEIVNPNSFLYQSGPIDSLDSPNLNVRQTYTLSEGRGGVLTEIASGLMTPPVNIGPKSTPDYEKLADAAIAEVGDGIKVFAGQRDDPFWVDLGGIGDLLTIRQLPGNAGGGVDDLAGLNVETLAIQVPITPADQQRRGPGRSRCRRRGHRCLDDRPATVDPGLRPWHADRLRRSRPGLPPRHAAGQRGRRAARGEGPLQLLPPRAMMPSSWARSPIPRSPSCSTCSTAMRW